MPTLAVGCAYDYNADVVARPGDDADPARGRCAACGRDSARPLYEVNGFAIVECACGLARTVLPPDFDPASIYTEAYFQGGHPDGYADYSGSGAELRHEFRRIVGALRHHVDGGRLVEIGCAYGYFLHEASATFATCGVEISDHARMQCAARGLDVAREATPEFLAARGPFDAAVMLDVLEHMRDPGDTLDRLHAAMRPGAQLLVTTGDFGSALARAMGRKWRLMTPPQHLWFFSPATVSALLARHGFRVHTVEHPWKMVPVALMAYQATRYIGGQGLVRRFIPGGRVPINLFDAMRVVAERIDRPATARSSEAAGAPVSIDEVSPLEAAQYELACRHARGRVLELECGDGHGTRLLADRGQDVTEAVGVDRSSHAIQIATDRHARPGVRFACGDATTLPARDGFDTVVSLDTLPYVDDPEATVVRLIAALRPNGVLVASVPTTPTEAADGGAHQFTEASFRARVSRYGLREIAQLEQARPHAVNPMLTGYYVRHPRAAARRLAATLRHGLTDRQITIVWQRS
jgi:2-polyprenyl-3-methyl-5-hydroxy-6-metoxy-1,4-benzoquinol methylase